MSFNIYLGKNNEPINKIRKNPNLNLTLTGELVDETSIVEPEILIEYDGFFVDFNYAQIPGFKRYYFITDVVSVRTGLWRIKLSCDVLKTYAEDILNSEGVIARQENNWNLYLNDDSFKTYQNPKLQIKAFPNEFSGESYVLVMNGANYASN